MKSLRNVLGLHFSTLILFGLFFPLLIWLISRLFPGAADGFPIYKNGKLIGFENIGQKFTDPKYFWGRPSAVDYNGMPAGASNSGPTNPKYLAEVEKRTVEFLNNNPEVKRSEIPSELVTASGSGLDPHISPLAAFIQIPRVAKSRNINREVLWNLVEKKIEHPLLGLFGPAKVNVLELNMALDELTK